MSRKFNDKLLEDKKKKAIEVVLRICKIQNFSVPFINFNGCSKESENELAHYHPDEKKICISERQLLKLDFEEIRETMAHEVAHISKPNHGPVFDEQEGINKVTSWNPKGIPGVAVINGGAKVKNTEKLKAIKIDKIRCNFHLCRKKVKLNRCEHCGKYFCNEHIKAFPPEPYDQNKHAEVKIGHACPDYMDYLEKEKRKAEERYTEVLDNLCGKPSKKNRITKTSVETEYIVIPKSKVEMSIVKEKNIKFKDKIKCFFGFHVWQKYLGPEHYGEGKFMQKLICKRCGKIKKVIK